MTEAKCAYPDCEDLVLHTVRGIHMCEGCFQQAAAYVRQELSMVPDVAGLTNEQINDAYISGEQDASQPPMDSPLHAVWELGWLDSK